MISNPEDRKKFRNAINEISNSYTRIQAERDLIKDIVVDISDKLQIPKRTITKIARIYYKQNFTEEQQSFEEMENLYEEMTS